MYDVASWAYWTALNDVDNEGSYVWSDGTPLDNNTMLVECACLCKLNSYEIEYYQARDAVQTKFQ